MDATGDDARAEEREFRLAVGEELHKLVSRGAEHGDAVDVLLCRLCGGAPSPDDAEVAALTGQLGYSRQDAVRALVVREELRALKARGLSNAAATRQLTRRVRGEAVAPPLVAPASLLNDRAPFRERMSAYPPTNGRSDHQHLPGLQVPAYGDWGGCAANSSMCVSGSGSSTIGFGPSAPQQGLCVGGREVPGAAPAWAGSEGKAPRPASRKRSAPIMETTDGLAPMDADCEVETKRRRVVHVHPPSPHHHSCHNAHAHRAGADMLAGIGGGGGGGACAICNGANVIPSGKRTRSPGRDDGSGGNGNGGGGGGGGGLFKRHRPF